jgi:CheY-like chemotaxis protein
MIGETVTTAMSDIRKNGKTTGLRNILVVDDHKLTLSTISKGLSVYLKDVTILTAKDGGEAVEILKSHPVASVLTDLNMPVMDGYELLRYLRKNYPDMPVFAMTSNLTRGVEELLRHMGVSLLKNHSVSECSDLGLPASLMQKLESMPVRRNCPWRKLFSLGHGSEVTAESTIQGLSYECAIGRTAEKFDSKALRTTQNGCGGKLEKRGVEIQQS